MMGYGADRGIIPLICEALFERITALTTDKLTFTVEVSLRSVPKDVANRFSTRSPTPRSTRRRCATC